jgi:hypothetical protein
MKKIFVIIILGLIFTSKIDAKDIEGKIILENETLNVILKIPMKAMTNKPNFYKLQDGITYYTSEGKEKKITGKEAKEIQFEHKGETCRMISSNHYNTAWKYRAMFLKIDIEGELSLYSHYALGYNSNGGYEVVHEYLLNKYNVFDSPKELGRFGMIDYFKDCPLLSKKIENRELKIRQKKISEIVKFYNANCN